MTGPSTATIKRLFAVSSNACAFPKCPAPLVHEGKVTGRVCHIKGKKSGAARFDANQSDEERHGFSNLILMCPIHHDVIDADELAYTVERLVALKVDHEGKNVGVLEINDDQAATFLQINIAGSANVYNQNVTSFNQTGGITAHAVNVVRPRRIMGENLKRQLLEGCPRDKLIVVWSIAGDDETHTLATEIYNFLKVHGWKLFGSGPSPNIFLGPQPRGIELRPGNEHNELIVGYVETS